MMPTNRRFTIFPFYFQQRSADTNEITPRLVPFYGHLKNRLLRDEIFFVMFPIYSETRKRDVVTDNYLYPVFDLRQGDGLHGWQFWPLVGAGTQGRDHCRPTDLATSRPCGHDRHFALWPIYLPAE